MSETFDRPIMRRKSAFQLHPSPVGNQGRARIVVFALFALFLFGLCVMLVVMLWRHASVLVWLGLDDRFYFIIVVTLSVLANAFLFGSLRSDAAYEGRYAGGTLKLGGPIVGVALIVVAAFRLPQHPSNFSLTVYVHGSAGPQDLPLRNQGYVLLDLAGDRRNEPIGDRGQAIFSEIPANFRGQKVNVGLDVLGYERRDNRPLVLEGTSLYLEVRRKTLHITGNVIDDETKAPVVGATVRVAGISTETLEQGHFDLELPSDHVQNDMDISVSADRYRTWTSGVTPDSGPFAVALLR
jgi:hypothetical protein